MPSPDLFVHLASDPIGVPLWFWTILFQRRNMLQHRDPDHYGTALSKSDGMLHVSGAVGHNRDKLNGWFERPDPERLPDDSSIFQKQGDTEIWFFFAQPKGYWVIADSDVKNMWHASGSGTSYGSLMVDEKKVYWKALDSRVKIPRHGGEKLLMNGSTERDEASHERENIFVKRHFDAMFMSFSFLFEDCEWPL